MAHGAGGDDVMNLLGAEQWKKKAKRFHKVKPLIHQAAEGGHIRFLRVLLDRGLAEHKDHRSVNESDRHGMTPLHCAAAGGHVDVMKLLLSKGADTNARSSKQSGKYILLGC